jgi:hypothetical protein
LGCFGECRKVQSSLCGFSPLTPQDVALCFAYLCVELGKEAELAPVAPLRVDTRLTEPVARLRHLGQLSQAHDLNSPTVIIAQEHKGLCRFCSPVLILAECWAAFGVPESQAFKMAACVLRVVPVSERGGITLISPEEAAKIEMARQLFGDKIVGVNSPQMQVSPSNGNRGRVCGPIAPETPFRITWDVIGTFMSA